MSQNILNTRNWYDDLCEYYNVSPQEALTLGTRASGRKPSLPKSNTTHAVSNMTFEDIWESKQRETIDSVFQFYKDQGAWSAFRQVVRHKDMIQLHINLLSRTVSDNSTFCEYGCGVAPFSYTLLSGIDKDTKLNICISDVDCEHFTFGKWRLEKLIKDRNLSNVNLEAKEVLVDSLPSYSNKIDTVFIFEVLEHVPSPVDTLKNIEIQMNPNGLICENFIYHNHSDDDDPGCDLKSAALERDSYYNLLSNDFTLRAGPTPLQGPNETRIWQKNT